MAAGQVMSASAAMPTVEAIEVGIYSVPTDAPESDGTLAWNHTTMVTVHARCDGAVGLGWTYADPAAGALIRAKLADVVVGRPASDIGAAWWAMLAALRNDGWPGLPMMAVSAVDCALWDLWAHVCERPLVAMLSPVCAGVPIYGSGGFTSYDDDRLASQLAGWVAAGIPRVKLKVGRTPDRDPHRVQVAREAIGKAPELFVDANGAYDRQQARRLGEIFAGASGVSWFEEPVSSDDVGGLRWLRDHTPAGLEIAAGEYAYTLFDVQRLLMQGAVDCLQLDATRCGGYTGFLHGATLASAACVPVSAHCAPNLHAHVACAVENLRHIEYFHDHVRLESLLFDGVLEPTAGCLFPDRSRIGHGLRLRREVATRYAVTD